MKLKIFQNNSLIEFLQGHKIKNPSGTALTQRESLKFTGDVTVTDDSSNDQTIVNITGGGSGGHTILNSDGSAMNQRGKLQFVGATVTDDSGNDKTVVTAPTPDYVDAQYSSSTTYSKGMTCISGNKRYRYINSTASSGHQPPNATYWEEDSASHDTGWITFTPDITCTNIFCAYRKAGSLVEVYLEFHSANSSDKIIYTLPEGFRPSHEVNSFHPNHMVSSFTPGCQIDIYSNGQIRFRASGGNGCIGSTLFLVG